MPAQNALHQYAHSGARALSVRPIHRNAALKVHGLARHRPTEFRARVVEPAKGRSSGISAWPRRDIRVGVAQEFLTFAVFLVAPLIGDTVEEDREQEAVVDVARIEKRRPIGFPELHRGVKRSAPWADPIRRGERSAMAPRRSSGRPPNGPRQIVMSNTLSADQFRGAADAREVRGRKLAHWITRSLKGYAIDVSTQAGGDHYRGAAKRR